MKSYVILDAVALFYLHMSDPPRVLKELQNEIIKNHINVVIPSIAIAEILWKKRKQGVQKLKKLRENYTKWKKSPNILIDSFDSEILDKMMEIKESYELHDEIIALTCQKYNTKTIYTRDQKMKDFWNLDVVSW